MDALVMNNGFASVKSNRCIGCGLCVPTCPEDAIAMVKKEKEYVPPVTEEQLFDEIQAYKRSLSGRVRIHSMKTLLRIASRFSNN
jgi:Fe-S-cluster-containing hydrogenase component 2